MKTKKELTIEILEKVIELNSIIIKEMDETSLDNHVNVENCAFYAGYLQCMVLILTDLEEHL